MLYLNATLMIAGAHRLISFFLPNFLPQSFKEFFISMKNGTVKAYRLIYLPLSILAIIEPQNLWKLLIMAFTIEVSFIIVPNFVSWIFKKIGK